MTWMIAGIAALLLVLIGVIGYVKAPPDQAYIISGLRKKIIVGRASIRIPFLERLDKLSLKMISVDVKTGSFVPTAEYINITVDAAVKLKISTDPTLLSLAAQNFLNKNDQYIVAQVQDVLEGNMREIIGQMKLEEMVTNRKAFAEKVQENAVPDLRRMGLEIISFNVQSFSDQNGVINDLGIDNISQIKKKAAIAKAEADRDIAKAQARANEEANDARIASDTRIAEQNNSLRIREAELQKVSDVKKAEADAAYEIQKQEQRKTIEVTSSNADIARREKEAELAEREIALQEKRLDAQIKKKADALKYEAEKQAEAELVKRQREADAVKYEQEQEAAARKAIAEAEKYEQEQRAAGIRAVGEAEAEAIRAKAIAEAEGIDRKAEAMQKYGEAAVLEMAFKALPEIAAQVAAPLANVDKITMYGDGNNTRLVSDIVNTTTQVSEGMNQSLGIDLKSLILGFLGGKNLGMPAQETPSPRDDADPAQQ